MIMFSKSRWTSIYFMLERLLKVRSALKFMVFALLNEKSEKGIDDEY